MRIVPPTATEKRCEAIPKGLDHSAQGCEERATLGQAIIGSVFNPEKGCIKSCRPSSGQIKSINPVSSLEFDATLSELMSCSGRVSQGSSFLATLGWMIFIPLGWRFGLTPPP